MKHLPGSIIRAKARKHRESWRSFVALKSGTRTALNSF
jgi:hypothetical protein